MSDSYSVLARHYDRLMEDVDYGAFCDFYTACFAKFSDHPIRYLLDLGCGTGSITVPLAARGFEITGIDLSADMLAVARKKAEDAGVSVCFSEQNMASFDVGGMADAALCSFDGINYLTSSADVRACFSRVHDTLTDGGLFLFDVGTAHHFSETLADNTFTYDYGNLFLSWQCRFHPKSGLCRYALTFFTEGRDGRFARHDETQRQRLYTPSALRRLLAQSGFDVVCTCADLAFSDCTEQDERCFWICRKK